MGLPAETGWLPQARDWSVLAIGAAISVVLFFRERGESGKNTNKTIGEIQGQGANTQTVIHKLKVDLENERRLHRRVAMEPPSVHARHEFPRHELELDVLGKLFLKERSVPPVVLFAGAFGAGKTTMARRMAEITRPGESGRGVTPFPDGLLWTSLGPGPQVREELRSWLKEVDPTADHAPSDIDEIADQIAGALGSRRPLAIVDDVWRVADLEPFLRAVASVRASCPTIVTTPDRDLRSYLEHSPYDVEVVAVGAMEEAEVERLVRAFLQDVVSAADVPADAVGRLVRSIEHDPYSVVQAAEELREHLADDHTAGPMPRP